VRTVRRLVQAGLGAVVAAVLTACTVTGNQMPDSKAPASGDSPDPLASDHPARLTARPTRTAQGEVRTGLHSFELGARQSYLFVPPDYDPAAPAPFVLALHGAGADARKAIGLLLSHARSTSSIVFAPQSQDRTWDVIAGGYGPDVTFIDRALKRIFERHAIKPTHVAVSGFSDGASYALSLGLTNGDLFKRIVALSPGFALPGPRHGRPRIFIAHGRKDGVLPYESTSKVIAPRLVDAGYQVDFRPHPDGHSPMPRLEEALDWLT
jgi:phospholipase/carboxylesterase